MPRRDLICPQCGGEFHSYKDSARFCSVACRREHEAHWCRNGHDVTLPGAVRIEHKANGYTQRVCIECEKASGARWRRKVGKKPREQFLASVRKGEEHHRRARRERATRYRRAAGVQQRVTRYVEPPSGLPAELRRAYGRADFDSMIKRKYPTLESFKRAYRAGELRYDG